MLPQKPSVTFFLDRSRPAADGKCLIKLNIYYKPDKKRYATKFHATTDEWEKINGTNLRDAELKKTKASLNALQSKAEEIVSSIDPFSFVAFEEVFYSNTPRSEGKGNTLKQWFDAYIKELRGNGQIGTSQSYLNTYGSLNTYKSNLMLQDITPAFLRGYESYMMENGKSTSTVGIYLRQLRAIINQAIAAKAISRDKYAFSEYTIPAARNVKKALKDTEVKTLLNFKAEKPTDQKAIDFWILSYLCSGINFADLVELKPANLQGNMLVFIRAKTKRTKKKDLRPIRIGVPPQALELIKKYQNTDPSNPYLFPILDAGLTPLTIKHRTKGFLKWVNHRTKGIASDLGIDVKLTTYTARHSFSTVLKRKGVPTAFIKDALGHSSQATTENYLDSFADEEMVSVSNKLTEL